VTPWHCAGDVNEGGRSELLASDVYKYATIALAVISFILIVIIILLIICLLRKTSTEGWSNFWLKLLMY